MAFVGSWGKFIHIPKCAGIAMRQYLKRRYNEAGYEESGKHDLPYTIENAFTVIRHPAHWLLSFYAYYSDHGWRWEELPQYVDDQFSFANTNNHSWPQYVADITTDNPGAVGKVFDYYCVPGVKVYKTKKLANHFYGIHRTHLTHNKPVMTLEQWKMICGAEQDTLERYGYNDIVPKENAPYWE